MNSASFTPPTPTSIQQNSYLSCMSELNMSSIVSTTSATDANGRVTSISPPELDITYECTGPALRTPESIGSSLYSGNAMGLPTEAPFNVSAEEDLPHPAMPNQISCPQDIAALEAAHSPHAAFVVEGEQVDENNTALTAMPATHQGLMQSYGQPISQDDGQFSLAAGCAGYDDPWSHGMSGHFFGDNNAYGMQSTQQLDVSGAMASLSSGASSSSSLSLAAHIPSCIPPAQLTNTHGVDLWPQRSENQQWAAALSANNCMHNNMAAVPEESTDFGASSAASAENLMSASSSACTQQYNNNTSAVSKIGTSVMVSSTSQSENAACRQSETAAASASKERPTVAAASRISSKVHKNKSRTRRSRASISHMDHQHATDALPIAKDNGQSSDEEIDECAEGKRKKRKTRSSEQKRAFYVWLVENIHSPYPNDSERINELNIDCMSKQEFKWWFSNHRHRSLEQYFDDDGKKCFRAKVPFYKACCRLNIHIPWEIPPDIRNKVKGLRR
ncbi:hypothetical protein H4R20_002800 [Coemansia guatemalensis]|uniref:Homeobox domain-containing protein n=1 Tax=Coemansia guatemalensis TaxID=2761395 RepID=A0A9W8LRZ7_9FUNG|nr:hypothetical protein H4R20_002800 [Coemansia guatemalensis]